MEENRFDRNFREKIGNLPGLPAEVSWNSDRGWGAYEQLYLQKESRTRRLWYFTSAAAILLVILSITIFQKQPPMITIINDTDEIREVLLPYGNHAWLRQNSTIVYPSRLNSKPVEIEVTGEVYIEIYGTPAAVYMVKSYNALIIAENNCGFNIRGLDGAGHVDIITNKGAVKVRDISYEEGLTLLVPEGNYCSVHKSQNLVYSSVNTNDNFLAWKSGLLTFNNTPIASVTDVLSEYYKVEIELEDKTLAFCKFTGTFKSQSIDKILHQMQNDLNVVVRNTGERIMISGKGCL